MTAASDDTPRPGEMTDDQLNQLLKAASTNLLDYITATSDLNLTLTAIMARTGQQAPAETPVSAMIRFRDAAHDIASALAMAPTSADDVGRIHSRIRKLSTALIPDSASDPVRVLERTHDLARTRTFLSDIASTIASTIALHARPDSSDITITTASGLTIVTGLARDSDLDHYLELDRDIAGDLGGATSIALASALDHARVLVQDLDSLELDASGEDLSGIEIRHLAALEGITWTRDTTWPPAIADHVEEHSYEIQPGVYQVRLGDTRNQHMLLTLA